MLRDPPGGLSTATWEKGSTSSVALTLDTSDAKGLEVAGAFGPGITGQFGMNIGFAWGALASAGIIAAEGESEAQLGTSSEASTERAVSTGSTVSLSASMSYTTSDDAATAGLASDLFVTPALSVRLITLLPIVFDCTAGGDEMPEVTRWEMIGGTDLYGSLQESIDLNQATQEGMDDALGMSIDADDPAVLQAFLRGEAEQASSSNAWNAATVHSVFDVVATRIPQLQKACGEEWYRLKCSDKNDEDDDDHKERCKLGDIAVRAKFAVGRKAGGATTGGDTEGFEQYFQRNCVGKVTPFVLATDACAESKQGWEDTDEACICKKGSSEEDGKDCQELFDQSRRRLRAASRAIEGWGHALRLNDALVHEFAEAVTAKQLFASPLLEEPVDEGDLGALRKSRLPGYPAALSAEFLRFESTNIEDHIGGQSGATMIPRPPLPKMPKAGLAPKGKMEMPKELKNILKPLGGRRLKAELGVPTESSVTAGAGIIAFSGGGATVTRSLAVARSAGLTLSIATESTTGHDNSLSFSVSAVGISVGGSYESSTSKGKTRSGEKAAEEESETVIEFTLGDDMIGTEPPRATRAPGLCCVVLCARGVRGAAARVPRLLARRHTCRRLFRCESDARSDIRHPDLRHPRRPFHVPARGLFQAEERLVFTVAARPSRGRGRARAHRRTRASTRQSTAWCWPARTQTGTDPREALRVDIEDGLDVMTYASQPELHPTKTVNLARGFGESNHSPCAAMQISLTNMGLFKDPFLPILYVDYPAGGDLAGLLFSLDGTGDMITEGTPQSQARAAGGRGRCQSAPTRANAAACSAAWHTNAIRRTLLRASLSQVSSCPTCIQPPSSGSTSAPSRCGATHTLTRSGETSTSPPARTTSTCERCPGLALGRTARPTRTAAPMLTPHLKRTAGTSQFAPGMMRLDTATTAAAVLLAALPLEHLPLLQRPALSIARRGSRALGPRALDQRQAHIAPRATRYVYCNIRIGVLSVCEDAMDNLSKYGRVDKEGKMGGSTLLKCNLDSPEETEDSACWEANCRATAGQLGGRVRRVRPDHSITCFSLCLSSPLPVPSQDKFEFTAKEGGLTESNFGLVEEQPIQRYVRIKCLSFDPTKDGCASDPCD